MNNNKKNKLKKTLKSILWIIVGAVISLTVTGLVRTGWGSFQTPESYKIIIVGAEDDKSISDFNEIINGLWKEKNIVFGKEEWPVKFKFITTNLESNNPNEINEYLNKYIFSEEGLIMVIGHFYSDMTMKTLPFYMNRSTPIPILCPMETNTRLTEVIRQYENENKAYSSPVFCFAPNDLEQAKKAADFAITTLNSDSNDGVKKIKKFWVVKDNENLNYSKDLANAFIDKIQDDSSGQVVLLSQVDDLPAVSTLQKLDFDCVFFAGFYENGRLLLNYLNYIYSNQSATETVPKNKKPLIILSDGCYDKKLFNNGTYDDFLGIYVTSSYVDVKTLSDRVYYFISTELLDQKINNNSNGSNYYSHPFYVLNKTNRARKAIKIALENINSEFRNDYRDTISQFYIKRVDSISGGNLIFTHLEK